MGTTHTNIMADFQSQAETEDDISLTQDNFRDLNRYGLPGSHHRKFGAVGGCFSFPSHQLVVLCLGLLNAVLLIIAVVTGVYCVKASSFQVPVSAATPLLTEINYLRNQSGIIRATVDTKIEIAKQQANHMHQKLQLKQHQISTDKLQSEVEILRTERDNLHSTKASLEENCGKCQPGWKVIKSSCYYFSSLDESNSKKNWLDSRADCISKGGELLVIDNLEEQQLLSNILPAQNSGGLWWEKGYWIGLTDVKIEGTWVWVNNVTEVETMYWRNGQPKRQGQQSGNCAALFYYSDTTRMRYNGNCHDHRYNWICERPASSV